MTHEIDEPLKLKLYQYVEKNVEDSILKTFNTLWDERNYWKYKPLVYISNNEIVAFAAYTLNEKYPNNFLEKCQILQLIMI